MQHHHRLHDFAATLAPMPTVSYTHGQPNVPRTNPTMDWPQSLFVVVVLVTRAILIGTTGARNLCLKRSASWRGSAEVTTETRSETRMSGTHHVVDLNQVQQFGSPIHLRRWACSRLRGGGQQRRQIGVELEENSIRGDHRHQNKISGISPVQPLSPALIKPCMWGYTRCIQRGLDSVLRLSAEGVCILLWIFGGWRPYSVGEKAGGLNYVVRLNAFVCGVVVVFRTFPERMYN